MRPVRIILITFLFIFVLGWIQVSCVSALFENPSFEYPVGNGYEPTSWDRTHSSIVTTNTDVYDGSQSVKIQIAGTPYYLYQTVDLTYITEITVWHMNSVGANNYIKCGGQQAVQSGSAVIWKQLTLDVSGLSGPTECRLYTYGANAYFDYIETDYTPPDNSEISFSPDVAITNQSDISISWDINDSDWADRTVMEIHVLGEWWNSYYQEWDLSRFEIYCDAAGKNESLNFSDTAVWPWIVDQDAKIKLYAELRDMQTPVSYEVIANDTIIYDPEFNYTYSIPPEEVLPNATMTPVSTPTLDTGVTNFSVNNTHLSDYYNDTYIYLNETKSNLDNSSNFFLRPIQQLTSAVNQVNASIGLYNFTSPITILSSIYIPFFGILPAELQMVIGFSWILFILIVIFVRRD